jgi:hypothetical protein
MDVESAIGAGQVNVGTGAAGSLRLKTVGSSITTGVANFAVPPFPQGAQAVSNTMSKISAGRIIVLSSYVLNSAAQT